MRLEENGILMDSEQMSNVEKENVTEMEKIKAKLFKKVGFEFNMDSHEELRAVIYTEMKVLVNPKFMTKGGKSGNKKPSTDKNAIEYLSKKYPQLKQIVKYRELAKQNSTSIEGFRRLINTETGRVYGGFLQHTAATGRLSSASPNLQNIPTDNRIRNIFIPSPGNKLVTCDLSQAELRILAMVSNDEKMLQAFMDGHDFHTFTACSMFKIPLTEFDKENPVHAKHRKAAKCINFGIAYQMGAPSLADDLNIPIPEAQAFINKFYQTYTGVKDWVDYIQRFASKYGYVETVHGRRRYLPQLKSSNEEKRSRALRQAVNTPIQGSASDCACYGLISLQNYIDEHHLKSLPIMIIHDEIVVDTHPKELDLITEILPKFMTENIPKINIPLVADLSILDRWEK